MSPTPEDPPPFPPFPVLSTTRVADSRWCGLRKDVLRLDDGSERDHWVFEIPTSVVVVPVLPDGSIVTLWQFRHAHGETHWEVPAGRIDEGETPAEAAERELLEETGHRAGRLERIVGFYPINGISPHHAHVFVAHDCTPEREPEHDPSERIALHVMGEAEVKERLVRGDFLDAFAALALFHHFARR